MQTSCGGRKRSPFKESGAGVFPEEQWISGKMGRSEQCGRGEITQDFASQKRHLEFIL